MSKEIIQLNEGAIKEELRELVRGYCQIKFATLDSVYHVTLPVYPVI